MKEHEDTLNPETIDMLTERPYGPLPLEEHRLVQDLYTLSQEYARENEHSLERIWSRLAQQQASSFPLLENLQNESGGKLLSMKEKRMQTDNFPEEMEV